MIKLFIHMLLSKFLCTPETTNISSLKDIQEVNVLFIGSHFQISRHSMDAKSIHMFNIQFHLIYIMQRHFKQVLSHYNHNLNVDEIHLQGRDLVDDQNFVWRENLMKKKKLYSPSRMKYSKSIYRACSCLHLHPYLVHSFASQDKGMSKSFSLCYPIQCTNNGTCHTIQFSNSFMIMHVQRKLEWIMAPFMNYLKHVSN